MVSGGICNFAAAYEWLKTVSQMLNVKIHIVGLTHHEVASRREEFLRSAVGRTAVLRSAPMGYDQRTMEAYVGAECVGVVSMLDLTLAQRAMNGSGQDGRLRGRIVEAEPYMLTVECRVEALGERMPMASRLAEWEYAGAVMPLPWTSKMDYLTEELELLLGSGDAAEEEVKELLDALCEVVRFDLSADGIEARSRVLLLLENPGGKEPVEELAEWHKVAAQRLREVSQRMGGDHWMEKLATWMHTDLATSVEAELLVAQPMALEEMMEAARRLPENLWELYRQDAVKFLRKLYGLRPSRDELQRVLSCVIWVDAHLMRLADDSIELGELARRVTAEKNEARRNQMMDDMLHLFSQDGRWAPHHAAILKAISEEEEARRARSQIHVDGNYVDVHDNNDVKVNK